MEKQTVYFWVSTTYCYTFTVSFVLPSKQLFWKH